MPINPGMNASCKSLHSNQTNRTNFTRKTTLKTPRTLHQSDNINRPRNARNRDQNSYGHQTQQRIRQFSSKTQCSPRNPIAFHIRTNICRIIAVRVTESCETYAHALTSADSVRKTLTYRKVCKVCFCVSYKCCDSYDNCSAIQCIEKCLEFRNSTSISCVKQQNPKRRR